MPVNLISEDDLRAALRPYRVDPNTFEAAVRRRLDCSAVQETLGGVDLVVTCVDQDGARLRAAHWARERLTPHLDIGALSKSPRQQKRK